MLQTTHDPRPHRGRPGMPSGARVPSGAARRAAAPAQASPAHAHGGLALRWHRTIAEIGGEWAECLGDRDILRSHALARAVELSRLPDVDLHYLVAARDGRTCAVIPCYVGRASLLTLANPLLQRIVDAGRRVFPGFLYVRLFVVGSPVSTSGDLLGFRDPDDAALWTQATVTAIMDEVVRKAKETRTLMTVVKELDGRTTEFLRARLLHPFLFVKSLPTTRLEVAPRALGGYDQSICSKYRNKLRKRKAVAAASGITWERRPDCRGWEDDVYRLYTQVLKNSDFVFERVNREFFLRVPEVLGDKAWFMMGFQETPAGRRLVSFELVMRDPELLHPFYSGFDYGVKQDSDLYFSAFYAMIGQAEEEGLQAVHLGQTAYEVKAELGATCHDLNIGVYHRWAWVRWVLFKLRRFLTTEVDFPERQVFRNAPTPRKTGQARKAPDPVVELAG